MVHAWLSRDSKCSLSETRAAFDFVSDIGWTLYQTKDFGWSIDCLVLDNGKVTVYCPDAIDLESFTTKNSPGRWTKTHNAYENVIVHDDSSGRRECHCSSSRG